MWTTKVNYRISYAAKTVNVNHVGIVASVDKARVITWEGNAGGKVAQRSYPLDSREIVGYGRPVYDTPK